MDAALRHKNNFFFSYHICVSILVLMDAALRLIKTCLEWKRDMSFNPCFDGCRPATSHYIQGHVDT